MYRMETVHNCTSLLYTVYSLVSSQDKQVVLPTCPSKCLNNTHVINLHLKCDASVLISGPLLKQYDAYLKKYVLWMKTIYYPNKVRFHLVTMAPFTPKSTSNVRSALHFRIQ